MTLEEFFFDTPIYSPVQVKIDFVKIIVNMNSMNTKEFHGYNPWAKLESTFIVKHSANLSQVEDGGYLTVIVKCKRTDNLFRYYLL